MQIKTLSTLPFNSIVDCFNESFADYFVKINLPAAFWEKRWQSDQVDFSLSFGMFDNEQLIGFIINGIGFREGKKTAFNAGTGVIPSYRGQRIVKQLYDHCLPILKKEGIQSSTLEVIQKNNKAIRAYQSVGFEIITNYQCFSGELKAKTTDNSSISFQNIKIPNWEKYISLNPYGHSWGNSKASIEIAGDYDCWEMRHKAELIGYFIVHPISGTIAQLEIKNQNWSKYGAFLFNKIADIQPKIKINNLNEKDRDKIKCLKKMGLKNTINQYEMKLKI